MFVVQESRSLSGICFLRLRGKPTNEELATYLDAERERILRDRGGPVVIVLELAEVWTSIQRKMMRDFELEMTEKARNRSLGMALVIPNGLIRGAFTAYYWIAPPQYPIKMIASAAQAYEWVSERLSEAGVTSPSREDYEREALRFWPARAAHPGKGLEPMTREQVEVQFNG